MTELIRAITIVMVIVFGCTCGVYGWEVEYRASMGLLPTQTSPAWKLWIDDGVVPSVSDGILRIQYASYGEGARYVREAGAIPAGVPATLEARLRVTQDTAQGGAMLTVETRGAHAFLRVHTNRIAVNDWGYGYLTYNGDFTAFRTIRLAYDGGTRAYAWVDGEFAFSWGLSGSTWQWGMTFGTPYYAQGESDSYWQYVAYSKEYLPIPEPSSLLALAVGIGGLGLGLVRRQKG